MKPDTKSELIKENKVLTKLLQGTIDSAIDDTFDACEKITELSEKVSRLEKENKVLLARKRIRLRPKENENTK